MRIKRSRRSRLYGYDCYKVKPKKRRHEVKHHKSISLELVSTYASYVAPLLVMSVFGLFFAHDYLGDQQKNDDLSKLVTYNIEEFQNDTTDLLIETAEVDFEIEEIEEETENISSDLLDSGYEFKTVDFDALKEINSDACGWLVSDNTAIDLPVVQGTDNEYYSHKDIYGNKSKYGTLFVDCRNESLDKPEDELSDLTIIYGHHMADGNMLASICNYKKQSYYDKHPFAVLYTPDGYAYKVSFFAGRVIDGNNDALLYVKELSDEEAYNAYINDLINTSTFQSDVEVKYGDKILALVTCSYETSNSRYVLYAKLEKELIKEKDSNIHLGLNY